MLPYSLLKATHGVLHLAAVGVAISCRSFLVRERNVLRLSSVTSDEFKDSVLDGPRVFFFPFTSVSCSILRRPNFSSRKRRPLSVIHFLAVSMVIVGHEPVIRLLDNGTQHSPRRGMNQDRNKNRAMVYAIFMTFSDSSNYDEWGKQCCI